ncbi:MAG: hypothetical protein DRG80_04230 [Deltaproteobacteria bacterium]|nr:MAG: hypothetical protein DRG80_04230 [Deltaproteobacteria bacterium]
MNTSNISGLTSGAAQSSMLHLEQQPSSVDREGWLSLLGKQVEVKVMENLDGGRFLVDMNGVKLVAEGEVPLKPGGIHLAEVVSVSPTITIRLLNVSGNLSPGLSEALALLLEKPNVFASRLGELGVLLQQMEGSESAGLRQVLQKFSSDNLLGKLGVELLRLPESLGLLMEQQIAALDGSRQSLLSRDISRFLEQNLKSELLKTGNWLSSQPQDEKVAKLATVIQDLLSLVTLNQLYNNAGVKQFDGLFLIFPLFLAENELDIWLKIKQHGKDPQADELDPLLTLSFYLDFPGFGRIGTRVIMMSKETLVSIQVEGKAQQALLQEQVPEVQQRLSGLLSRQVSIKVEEVSGSRLLDFWQENFLDELPGLIDVQA